MYVQIFDIILTLKDRVGKIKVKLSAKGENDMKPQVAVIMGSISDWETMQNPDKLPGFPY